MVRAFTIICFLLVSSSMLNGQGVERLSFRLQDSIQNTQSSDYIEISILLSDRVNVRAMDLEFYAQRASLNYRTQTVISALKTKAATTQTPLLEYLNSLDGVSPGSIQSFWVTNVVFCTATAESISALALRPDIEIIDINAELLLDDYVVEQNGGVKKTVGGHEPGHDAIKAPAMWAMGYSGYGRKVMSLDTGVDPYHVAISDHFDGYYHSLQQSWFVLGRPPEMPTDCNGHGTHTVGTMCGLDTANSDTIGVAWGARWIGSPNLCGGGSSTDRNIAGFQYAMDPDGDPATIEDMPDVINNSWRDPNTVSECTGLYKSTFDAVEAVGIAIVFSAGNAGSGASTITQPKNINTDLVNVFCVANVNGNVGTYPIAGSSSRGPSTCGGTGSLNIKPEVAAPGSSVRSCYQGDYTNLTGTSMAAPHVAGSIALLKEPFPYLTGSEIKLALYNSCVDLGDPGEDNDYGMGIIDVPAAYNYLIGQGNTPVTPPVNDAAAINVLGIDAYNCDTTAEFILVLENRGSDTLFSVTILYSINQGDTMSLFWTDTLAPMDTAHVAIPTISFQPGTHEFSAHLILPNAVADERTFNDKIRRMIEIPNFAKSTGAGHICVSGKAILGAEDPGSGLTVSWFAQPSLSPAIGTGLSYTTPVLTVNSSFYSDIRRTDYTAKFDTSGGGAYQASTNRYLVFDCFNPFTLVSVKVFSDAAGNRRVELRSDLGTILDSVTVFIPVGESRVSLDFYIPVGTDYRLGLAIAGDLYRNNVDVLFPYTIPGVVSIKTSDQGPRYYYYYYDWEVAYWSPCGRTEVPVYINQPITANISYSPAIYNLLDDDVASFQDNTVGAVSWLWDFGDGVTSTQQNVSHTFEDYAKTYDVELIVSDTGNACSDTITINYEVVSGAEDEVFPNPSTGHFSIDIKLIQSSALKVSLYDFAGRVLLDGWYGQANGTFFDVDLSALADGTYIIVIQLPDKKLTERLVKVSE